MAELHARGRVALVQPHPASVDARGETGLPFYAGRFSPAYARIDLVLGDNGGPAILELELTEPSMRFAYADEAAPRRFAAILEEIARTG